MEKTKRINHYSVNEVIDRFEINKNFDQSEGSSALLKAWLTNPTGQLKPAYHEILEEARQQLELKWDEWNEEELKMNFISFVILAAQIEVPKRVNTYYERRLSGKVRDILISVIVDCMIASPTHSGRPKSPYFFMQEFKRSLGDSHDPEGQMLAAMILAQHLNQDQKPLYGCWVQGVAWRFTVLFDSDYSVSRSFDASSQSDLLQIVFILRKLKDLILNRASN